MELKYIWIEEYKNLKDIDFNFKHSINQEFIYSFGELKIADSIRSCPKDFFGPNIEGVTAIVGKNGSGKTNLTEIIHYSLSHVGNGGLSRWITSKSLIIIGHYIFIQKDIPLLNEKELTEKGYRVSRYDHVPLDQGQDDLRWHKMEMNKYIYYNPVFDFRILPMGSGRDNVQNISTSYLAWHDVYHNNIGDKQKADLLRSHERLEKLREADLILNFTEIVQFLKPVPTNISVSVDVVSENNLVEINYYTDEDVAGDVDKKILKQQYKELQNQIDNYKGFYLERYRVKEEVYTTKYLLPIDVKKEFFLGMFWVNFFCIFLKTNSFRFPEDFFRKFIYDLDWHLDDVELKRKLSSLKLYLKDFIESCMWIEKIQSTKDGVLDSYDERENSIYDLFRHTTFDTSSAKNKKLLNHIIEIISAVLNNNLPFHYQYHNKYSSGQQKRLNFYSRFHWASKEIVKDENDIHGILGERVIILIDEGEVSLHPEWQRNFFENSITFLSELFKDKKLQLILITHSPFVLSDIPKDNVIFIDRDVEGNAIIKKANMEKTFGANIYSLLADSFFMENGTMGEFAKRKIEWAMEALKLNGTGLIPESLVEVDYIIENIGEPLIKQQLEIMRSNSLNQDKVSTLEKRVKELEDELRNRSNDNN